MSDKHDQLLNVPEDDEATMDKLREASKDSKRDQAILETFYCTGVRAGELAEALISDFNEKEGVLKIKGKKSAHYIPLSIECVKKIRAYLDSREDKSEYLFVTNSELPFNTIKLSKLFKELSLKANLDQRVTPIAFRRSITARLYQIPIDVIAQHLKHDYTEHTRWFSYLKNSNEDSSKEITKIKPPHQD